MTNIISTIPQTAQTGSTAGMFNEGAPMNFVGMFTRVQLQAKSYI